MGTLFYYLKLLFSGFLKNNIQNIDKYRYFICLNTNLIYLPNTKNRKIQNIFFFDKKC